MGFRAADGTQARKVGEVLFQSHGRGRKIYGALRELEDRASGAALEISEPAKGRQCRPRHRHRHPTAARRPTPFPERDESDPSVHRAILLISISIHAEHERTPDLIVFPHVLERLATYYC